MSLRKSICTFVERNLGPIRQAHAKSTVPDPIYGSFELEPWEISLSRTPIMQRLKRIHQMGVAFHIYFAAVHTRFEHSLGTAFLVGEVLRVLVDNELFEDSWLVDKVKTLHHLGGNKYTIPEKIISFSL